jgi:uncharacterized membrane protein YfcA
MFAGRAEIRGVPAGDIQGGVGIFLSVSIVFMLPLAKEAYKHGHWRIAIASYPSSMLFVVLGARALVTWDTFVLEAVLGGVFVFMALYQYGKRKFQVMKPLVVQDAVKDEEAGVVETVVEQGLVEQMVVEPAVVAIPEEKKPCTQRLKTELKSAVRDPITWASVFVGAAAGFLRGAFSTPGPPLMIFFAAVGMKKLELRATSALQGLVAFPFQIYSVIAFQIWKLDDLMLYLICPVRTRSFAYSSLHTSTLALCTEL